MIITCDATCSMGYIYLQKPTGKLEVYLQPRENGLKAYMDLPTIQIPVLADWEIGKKLEQMTCSPDTYSHALGENLDQEYCNDLDDHGYICGVELTLRKEYFLDLIEQGAFTLFTTEWLGKSFRVVTLDRHEEVFAPTNLLYPCTHDLDVWLIVNRKEEYQIGLIKGLITSRDDLYPPDYLASPLFYLSE